MSDVFTNIEGEKKTFYLKLSHFHPPPIKDVSRARGDYKNMMRGVIVVRDQLNLEEVKVSHTLGRAVFIVVDHYKPSKNLFW